MEFEFWWLLAFPLFFGMGWLAARIDIKHLVSESRSLPRSYFKGLNFLLNEQPDKAIEAFIEVAKVDPETIELHFALGSLFRRRGETKRAIRMHQNLLERGDRMTMAKGLELRVPFLDKRLAPFGLALPPNLKVKGRVLKHVVRVWAGGRIPDTIARRPKWGFRVPLANWFRGPLRELLHDHLGARDGLCGSLGNGAAVSDLLSRHDHGELDANLELWTLLVAEVWYQDVFRHQVRAEPRHGPT